jgi:hypothetical protein
VWLVQHKKWDTLSYEAPKFSALDLAAILVSVKCFASEQYRKESVGLVFGAAKTLNEIEFDVSMLVEGEANADRLARSSPYSKYIWNPLRGVVPVPPPTPYKEVHAISGHQFSDACWSSQRHAVVPPG